MIGLTEVEQKELIELQRAEAVLQRAEALGNLASQGRAQAAAQSCAGGWIGLTAEEERELQQLQAQPNDGPSS